MSVLADDRWRQSPLGRVGRGRRCGRLVILILLCPLLAVPQASALPTAQEDIDRGYDFLAQAHRTAQAEQREQLVSAAIKAFSKAYQHIGQSSKVQALLGAAQGYLLMRKAPVVFPFLWSASPLERAAKSLQQALVLQPDNSAAAFLMGVTLWRQAETAASHRTERYQRSAAYLARAAELGIPVQLPTADAGQASSSVPAFRLGDTILTLRYVDARGTGSLNDLLLVYHTAAANRLCYGVIVSSEKAYPLMASRVNGTMALGDSLDDLKVIARPHDRPVVTAVVQQGERQVTIQFVWDGSRFVFTLGPPGDP